MEESFGNSPARTLLTVVTEMLEGETLVREDKPESGPAWLRAAVQAEDALHCDGPPGWSIPVRRSLMATLLRVGRRDEAETVCREDLRGGRTTAVRSTACPGRWRARRRATRPPRRRARFREVRQKADVESTGPCLCRMTLWRVVAASPLLVTTDTMTIRDLTEQIFTGGRVLSPTAVGS